MYNLEIIEANIRCQLNLLPFSTPDNHESESGLRSKLATIPSRISAVIGAGTGAMDYVETRASQGWKVLVFDQEVIGGRLHSVASEKPFLGGFMKRAFTTTSRPLVHTHLPVKVDLANTGDGLNLKDLTQNIRFDEVVFATGTAENHTELLDNTDNLDRYSNYKRAYSFTRNYNQAVLSGKRPSELRIGYNLNGKKIYINGAGLVAAEDMTRKVQAIEIDYMLAQNKFDPRNIAHFSYERFTSSPLKVLGELYNANEEVRSILGSNIDFNNMQSVLARLEELGCKPIVMMYRKSEKALINSEPSKPPDPNRSDEPKDTRMKKGSYLAFVKAAGFTLLDEREPATIVSTNNENQITQLQLLHGIYEGKKRISYTLEEVVEPAAVFDALGGAKPTVMVGDMPIAHSVPTNMNGTIFAFLGNAAAGQGNERASRDWTMKMTTTLTEKHAPIRKIVTPGEWSRSMGYLCETGLVPTNVIAHTLAHLTDQQIEKWGWA